MRGSASASTRSKGHRRRHNSGLLTRSPLTEMEHVMSTIALCSCALSISYLVISVFPYSGYMAISLVPFANEENAGYYSGLLASSFMMGRSLTSYCHWGNKAADIYGRKTILFASLSCSIVFSILFGLSTSFPLALLWRFFLGLGNGMMSTVKTVVSELAADDGKRETRAMGIVMAMWGWGFFICPAISGAVAEPTKQYADWWQQQEQQQGGHAVKMFHFLDTFPFILPNLIGALLCLVSMLLVALFVPETLPRHRIRDRRFIAGDLFRSFHESFLSVIPEVSERRENSGLLDTMDEDDDEDGEEKVIANNYNSIDGKRSDDNSNDDDEKIDDADDAHFELACNIKIFIKDDVQDAIRASIQNYNEEIALLHIITGNERGSITKAALRRASFLSEQQQQRGISDLRVEDPIDFVSEEEATIKSLWARAKTRHHMIVYWIASFVLVAVDEGFPLFCISKKAGLGLSEYSIGSVLSASGLLFVFLQYLIYAALIESFGIYGSLRITSLAFFIIAIVPLSLWLNRNHQEEVGDDLAWATFSFLSILLSVYRVFAVAYFTTLMVALNRTVVPSRRGTMNDLATMGGSIAKCVGPTFAGFLVAFSLSSGFFSPHAGAVFLWLVIGGLGCVNSIATFMLLHED